LVGEIYFLVDIQLAFGGCILFS